ncbi:MAG: TIGR00159 family protein [Bacteroidaceae bacterium]|nr:TIGR00159 family protein [Bacteroidaceae bacterium]
MLEFGVKDFIDVTLVAIILYYCYKVMKRSRSVNIFYGILLFVTFWIVISKMLEMKLLGGIMDQLVSVGAIAIIVLFQEEIRHFFYNLGTHPQLNVVSRLLRTASDKDKNVRYSREVILPVVMACLNMSRQRVGALIVFQNTLPLNDFMGTGEPVDASISQRLIENIFFKNSPLHDGALIIQGSKIAAAACVLPVSHDLDIPKEYGLRHRAAKGISQESDALAVVVSEETGVISAAFNNRFKSNLSAEELEMILMEGRF